MLSPQHITQDERTVHLAKIITMDTADRYFIYGCISWACCNYIDKRICSVHIRIRSETIIQVNH